MSLSVAVVVSSCLYFRPRILKAERRGNQDNPAGRPPTNHPPHDAAVAPHDPEASRQVGSRNKCLLTDLSPAVSHSKQ